MRYIVEFAIGQPSTIYRRETCRALLKRGTPQRQVITITSCLNPPKVVKFHPQTVCFLVVKELRGSNFHTQTQDSGV